MTEGLKIMLALEPKWTVSFNGHEFLVLNSSEIHLGETAIRFRRYSLSIIAVDWLRPNVVRIRGRARNRSATETITLYPGENLPCAVALRRNRRIFQAEIGRALCSHFGIRKIE